MKFNNFGWLNEESITFLKRGYLEEGVEPRDRVKEIGKAAGDILNIEGFEEKFINYMSKGWISLSSPVWANFGLKRGLPISCFNTDISDSTDSILYAVAETGMMSKMGGGTSAYFGKIRPRGATITAGGRTNGSVSFMEIFETTTNAISQNGIRRGSLAATLPIDHGDIEEFLTIRNDDSPIQNLSIGVTVGDRWMDEMISGDTEKRKIWGKVLKKRSETGFPYIMFRDTANKAKPQVYKDKDKVLNSSNLCQEIMLPSDEKESFVCCLSSLNLYKYDEWKDSDLVETMLLFLDAVTTEFISKTENMMFMERPRNFAKNHRALGLGVLGLHSYLQSKKIPFEGLSVKSEINKIFSNIRNQADQASKKYAKIMGEPPILKGYGERWTTKLAVAPTTSSSFILGQVSPSIEPLNSNYFIKDLAKGKFSYKNPHLIEVLENKNKNTREVWDSILKHGGSVQHLKFLTPDEKSVFKTFSEISQMDIVQNAAIMQKYIDQGISLNLMISNEVSPRDINKLVIEAWKLGIKTLYYQKGVNLAQKVNRDIINCVSCEG